MRVMNERGIGIGQFPIGAPSLGELLVAIRSGDIDNSRAKEVFAGMLESGRSAKQEMESRGIAKADAGEVEALCRELVAANPRIAADVRGGKEQAVGALVGQAKKKNPNADPGQVRRICLEIIRNGG